MRTIISLLCIRSLLFLLFGSSSVCASTKVVETRDPFRWEPCDRFVALVLEAVPAKPPNDSPLDSGRDQVAARLHESAGHVVRLMAMARTTIITSEREIRKGSAVVEHLAACKAAMDSVLEGANEFVSAVEKSGYGDPVRLKDYLSAFAKAVATETRRIESEFNSAQPGATDNPGNAQ